MSQAGSELLAFIKQKNLIHTEGFLYSYIIKSMLKYSEFSSQGQRGIKKENTSFAEVKGNGKSKPPVKKKSTIIFIVQSYRNRVKGNNKG